MSESNATKTLKKALRVYPKIHFQRFEDKLTPGIPDLNFCYLGKEFWLEGKHLKTLPARGSSRVRFGQKGEPRLAHQCHWLNARKDAGGRAFLWLRIDDAGWFVLNDGFRVLIDGLTKDALLGRRNFKFAKDVVKYIIESN